MAGAPRELIAVGGALDVETLVAAYRAGCFPWPPSGRHAAALDRQARALAKAGEIRLLPGGDPTSPLVPWCSPHPRAVVLPDQLQVSRSLRQRLRRSGWTATMDAAFPDVIAGCADRAEDTWITAGMQQGYTALRRAGVAHSVEIWDGDRLVGGLYGVLTGRVFSGESMFYRENDASKVAVVELCDRLVEAGVPVLDTQQETEHMTAMGQVLVSRQEYLSVLSELRDQPAVLATDRRPVDRLA